MPRKTGPLIEIRFPVSKYFQNIAAPSLGGKAEANMRATGFKRVRLEHFMGVPSVGLVPAIGWILVEPPILGSARVPRVGEGVSPSQTFQGT